MQIISTKYKRSTVCLGRKIFLVVCLLSFIFMDKSYSQKKTRVNSGFHQDSLQIFQKLIEHGDSATLKRMRAESLRQDTSERVPNHAEIKVFARSYNDSIILRWAPSKAGGWVTANRIGYFIERYTYNKNGTIDKASKKILNATPIKPWTESEWKSRVKDRNKFAAISAQALYGKRFTQTSSVGAESANQIRNAIDELNGRFGFSLLSADFDVISAEGLGLRHVDRSVEGRKQYAYRIYLAAKDSVYMIQDGYVFIDAHDAGKTQAPIELTAQGSERKIALHWKAPSSFQFSGYYLYRSEDGGKSYQPMNKDPFTVFTTEKSKDDSLTYTDTNAKNYKVYKYRIAGITPFAELSEYAEIESFARDMTPPARPYMKSPKEITTTSLRLDWEMDDTTGDIAGFIVLRSINSMYGFHPLFEISKLDPSRIETELKKQLLPKTDRTYIDAHASLDEPYYIVAAVDTAGNVAESLPVYAPYVDTFPPSVPTGFAGTMDTNGIVHLHWNLGMERNLLGYRLFYANDPSHEFTPRNGNPVQDTSYTDTASVQTLTPYAYYKIAAVKKSYANSGFSSILAIKRPDNIPPVPPVFTDVRVTDRSVNLYWTKSSSKDIESYILDRRQRKDEEWKIIISLKADAESYNDTLVKKNIDYEYQLEAFDTSGNRSISPYAVHGAAYDNGIRVGITNIRAVYEAEKKSVRITWDYPVSKEDYWFVIYRSLDGAPISKYKSASKTEKTFNDGMLYQSKKVTYAIKVMLKNGGESLLSDEANVDIQ